MVSQMILPGSKQCSTTVPAGFVSCSFQVCDGIKTDSDSVNFVLAGSYIITSTIVVSRSSRNTHLTETYKLTDSNRLLHCWRNMVSDRGKWFCVRVCLCTHSCNCGRGCRGRSRLNRNTGHAFYLYWQPAGTSTHSLASGVKYTWILCNVGYVYLSLMFSSDGRICKETC